MFDGGVFPYSTQQVGMQAAEEFPLCLAGVPLQDNLVLLCRYCDPQRAKVPVLLKLPWLAVDVFTARERNSMQLSNLAIPRMNLLLLVKLREEEKMARN